MKTKLSTVMTISIDGVGNEQQAFDLMGAIMDSIHDMAMFDSMSTDVSWQADFEDAHIDNDTDNWELFPEKEGV